MESRSRRLKLTAGAVVAGVAGAMATYMAAPAVVGADQNAARGDAAQMALQTAGRGFLEEHPPGVVDGARFEGRFVIFGMSGKNGQVFGDDASLFDPTCVAAHGRGPQCAHFVAVRSGYILEGFSSSDATLTGYTMGRTGSESRMRIIYDAHPDGSRSYENRASFLKGEVVATYTSDEYFAIDPRAGIFDTRVDYRLLDSKPFQFNGQRVNFETLAPHMTELDHGHNPEPDPNPTPIPSGSPFDKKGPGTFAMHFPVGGTMLAVGGRGGLLD